MGRTVTPRARTGKSAPLKATELPSEIEVKLLLSGDAELQSAALIPRGDRKRRTNSEQSHVNYVRTGFPNRDCHLISLIRCHSHKVRVGGNPCGTDGRCIVGLTRSISTRDQRNGLLTLNEPKTAAEAQNPEP